MSWLVTAGLLVVLLQTAGAQEPRKKDLESQRLDLLIELAEAKRDGSRIEGSLNRLNQGKFDAASDKTLDHLKLQLEAAEKTLSGLRAQKPSDETKRGILAAEARVAALTGKIGLAQKNLGDYFRKELSDTRIEERQLKSKLRQIQAEIDRPAPPPAPIIVEVPSALPVPQPVIVQPPAPPPKTQPVKPPEPQGTRVSPKDSLEYTWIPPGTLKMGCVPNDQRCEKDEYPAHEVTFKTGFWITNTEVTAGAYVFQFNHQPPKTSTNPKWKLTELPVTKVKWREAEDYCEWAGGRLPTEAEWEYAARGGAKDDRIYPWGDAFNADRCNSTARRKRRDVYPEATPVRMFPANGWGLFGMIGNVREWILDVYTPDGYSDKEPPADPRAAAPGKDRVVRGGSFGDGDKQLRTSHRDHLPPERVDNQTGFRCVILEAQFPAK